MISPYWNTNFMEFIQTFFMRFPNWIRGELVHDEVQVFALFFLSISCSLLGFYLVYRKMSMIANSLSHTALIGVVSVYLLSLVYMPVGFSLNLSMQWLILAAFITSLVTYFLTNFLSLRLKVQEDASIGLVFTFLFAIGVIMVTLFSKNAHIGVEVIMGNLDAIHQNDLFSLSVVALITAFAVLLIGKELFLSTFDSQLAKSFGFYPLVINFLLMMITSLVIISGFRSVGLILILNFLIAPIVISRMLTANWKLLIGYAIGFSIVVSFIAVALSRHILTEYGLPLSTSGIVCSLYFFSYLALLFIHSKKGFKLWKRKKLPS